MTRRTTQFIIKLETYRDCVYAAIKTSDYYFAKHDFRMSRYYLEMTRPYLDTLRLAGDLS